MRTSTKKRKSHILAVVIVLILVLAGVYFFFFTKKTGTSLIRKIIPVSTLCKYNDKDLCKFINRWKGIDYFTINLTSTFEGKEVKLTMKSIGKDKSQVITSQGASEEMNIITIGNNTYTKDFADGKWAKTAKNNDSITNVKGSLNFEEADSSNNKIEYKKTGTEACGNLTCFKYQLIDPAATDSTEYVLFDNKEYQLRKTIAVGKDNNQSISEFDYSKISIDTPSPIK